MRQAAARQVDLVLKVGGSLGRRRGRIGPLMREVAELARDCAVLVVPGGGRFADLVRSEMRRLDLGEAQAHRMALLGMDQYGLALAGFTPGARVTRTLNGAVRLARAGRTPILLAAAMVAREPNLEKSFRLTSDSIAAFVATRLGARRLVLLKSVPRLNRKIATPAGLARLKRQGIVDPLFPAMAPKGAEVWILDGSRPAGLRRFRSRPPAARRRLRSATG